MNDLIDGQWQPGTWRDLEKLTCIICQWDTLHGLDAAHEHAAGCLRCHPQPVEPTAPLIPLADKHGREIKPGG